MNSVETAGGKASTGEQRILDCVVEGIHQRTPLFIGSSDLVNTLEYYCKNNLQ